MNRILGQVDEARKLGNNEGDRFMVGEMVKVKTGPFSGFSGVIEEVNEEKEKIKSDGEDFRKKNATRT